MRALGAQLSQAGAKRLDDEMLLTSAEIKTKLMMRADVARCASLFRGGPGGGLMPLLELLEPEELDQFFEVIYQSTVAELLESPAARNADSARVEETMRIILDDLPESERERLRAGLIKGVGDNDEETCWMGRTLQQGINRLDREDRIQWILLQ